MSLNLIHNIFVDIEIFKAKYHWWRDQHTIVFMIIMANGGKLDTCVVESRRVLAYNYSNDYILDFISDVMTAIEESNNNE